MKVEISLIVNRDEKLSYLSKRATALKDEGKINEAVACLREAQKHMRKSNFSHPAQQWCRLPLFLQMAGRFDEAMAEFHRLLAELDKRMLKEYAHLPEEIALSCGYTERAVIYDKMRLACKREKRKEEAEKWAALSQEMERKAEEAMSISDRFHEERSRAFRDAQEQFRAGDRGALDRFFERYPQRYR
ncbi:hypothetical protein [Thiofaba sp. EF100]|uniref:hypothetical protein n=1 Tax=Thiofaba sp. EF100 TaxID=3121274 RepID=UPI003221AB92